MQTPAAAWHARAAEHVFKALHSSSQGLSSSQAQARLRDSGENRIEREAGQAWLRVLLRQPGDQIAADVRLFDVNGLSIEESMLTGDFLSDWISEQRKSG